MLSFDDNAIFTFPSEWTNSSGSARRGTDATRNDRQNCKSFAAFPMMPLPSPSLPPAK